MTVFGSTHLQVVENNFDFVLTDEVGAPKKFGNGHHNQVAAGSNGKSVVHPQDFVFLAGGVKGQFGNMMGNVFTLVCLIRLVFCGLMPTQNQAKISHRVAF